MGKQSQINGKRFEEQLCKYYSKYGYFVIYNEKGVTGAQCCDLVIIKNDIATLLEAKNLTNKSGIFNLERIEQNQLLAYKRYTQCQNSRFILAINWNGGVYLLDLGMIDLFDKSIKLKDLQPDWRWEDVENNE